jgi:hypothetical protein
LDNSNGSFHFAAIRAIRRRIFHRKAKGTETIIKLTMEKPSLDPSPVGDAEMVDDSNNSHIEPMSTDGPVEVEGEGPLPRLMITKMVRFSYVLFPSILIH